MIEKLENVTAIAKANVYFDGKVVSHTIYTAEGDRKTLGLFLPGDYEFGTGDAEIMEIIDGVCQVRLPGTTEYMEIKAGLSTCQATASSGSAATYLSSTCVPTYHSAERAQG